MSKNPNRLSATFERMSALDKTVHEPVRLVILTALSACRSAQFKYLQALTGTTQGNLSVHLARLQECGLIEIEKGFNGHYPNTSAKLTERGRQAISRHWQQLDQLRTAVERASKPDSD